VQTLKQPLAHHVHLVNSSTAAVDDLSGFHATAVHTALTVRLQGLDNSTTTTTAASAANSSASYDYTSAATTPTAASSARNSGSFSAVQQALWASIRLDLMNQLTTASVPPPMQAATTSTGKQALRVHAAADVHTGGISVLLWRVDGSKEGLLLHTDVTSITVNSVTASSVTAATAVTAELSGLRVDALDSLSASDFEVQLHEDAASRKLFAQVAHGSYAAAGYKQQGAESFNLSTPDYNNFNSGVGSSTASNSGFATTDNSPLGPNSSTSGHLFSSSIGSNSGGSTIFNSTFSNASSSGGVFSSSSSSSANVFNSGTRPQQQQQQQQPAAAAAVVDTFILSAVTISLCQRTGSAAADAQQQFGVHSNVRSSNTAQRVLNVYEPRLVWNLSIRDRVSGLVDDLNKYKRAATATTAGASSSTVGSGSPTSGSSAAAAVHDDSAVFQDAVDNQQSCDDLTKRDADTAAAAVTPR
jgi:hypothetical protein